MRVLESLAGGILCAHPIGVGVLDPCEPQEIVGLTEGLMLQSKEDVTASAQHALRQTVFKQIHKVNRIELAQKASSEHRREMVLCKLKSDHQISVNAEFQI